MSHLSAVISRVKTRAGFENPQEDALFEQAVINLMEYLESWTDATETEKKDAIQLYDKFRPLIKGKGMPSHKDRLDNADLIRVSLEEPEPYYKEPNFDDFDIPVNYGA